MNSFILGLIVRALGSEDLQDEAAGFIASAADPVIPDRIEKNVLAKGLVNLAAAFYGVDPETVDAESVLEGLDGS